jgi:hypothetical protein
MMRALLVRGMVAGLVAGVVATLFGYLAGEGAVDAAIAVEAAHGAEHGAEHGEEVFSRAVQSTIGLFTGVTVYGVAIGGLFAIAFAFVHGRMGALRPNATTALLTASAFVTVVLVPFVKYPANPPAVGVAGTIRWRTELYFGFVAISVVFAIAAAYAGRKLTDRWGAWSGGLVACGAYVAAMAVCGWLLPTVDEVPADFPASALWDFRVASLGTQLSLWTALGLTFGLLLARQRRRVAAH